MPRTSTSFQRLSGYVTGKWALSLRLFPLFALAAFYPSLILEPTFAYMTEYRSEWFVSAIVGFLSLFLFWFSVQRIWGSTQHRPLKLWQSFLISGLGGAFQGVTIAVMINYFDIPDLVGLVKRIISGFIIVIFWLPLSSILSASFYDFSEFQREALNDLASLEKVKLERSDLAQEIRRKVEQELQASLTISTLEARRQYDQELENISLSTNQIPEILRGTAHRDVRQFVHELLGRSRSSAELQSESESLKLTRRPFLKMLKIALQRSYPNPFVVVAITLVTLLPIEFRNDPLEKAAAVSLLLLIPILLLHLFAYALWKWQPKFGPLFYILAVAFSQVIPYQIISPIYPDGIGLGEVRFHSIWGGYQTLSSAVIGIGLLIPVCATVLISRDDAKVAFQKAFEVERVRQKFIDTEISIFTRRWAQKVHGTLQSQLVAAALTIERAAEQGNMNSVAIAIGEARDLLERPISIDEDRYGHSLRTLNEEVAARVEPWRGIIELQSSLNFGGEENLVGKKGLIADAIEEAISNAVRHGEANFIKLEGTLKNNFQAQLRIWDNGKGIISGRKGFGTEVFQSLCDSNWELVRENDQTRLTLEFDLHPQSES